MLDIKMPKEDGISLGLKIKKLYPSLPLVAISSIGENISREYITIFTHFLIKPIKEKTLLNVCYNILK